MNDPLDAVFETPEESLAHFLRTMPPSLIPVFQREFMRRPTPIAVDVANAFCKCVDPHFDIVESCSVCGKPPRH